MFEADLAVTESEPLTGGAVSIGPPELPRKKAARKRLGGSANGQERH